MDAIGGLPVWLCSVSRRDPKGMVVPTHRWSWREREHAERLIDRVLGDCGDPSIQRQFRMCVTACRHRATSRSERASFSEAFLAFRPTDIAGSPVEVLWSRGIPENLDATRPCLAPGKQAIGPGLYLLVPCDRCDACTRNEAVRAVVDGFRAENPGRYLLETT